MFDPIEQRVIDDKKQLELGKVISLFKFIRELNQLKHKAVLNVKDHLWFYPLANVPVDSDSIHIFYRDREDEDITENTSDFEDILLSVQKPEFKKCPNPDAIFKGWLSSGWEDFHNSVTHSEAQSTAEDSDSIKFNDDPTRVDAYEKWLQLRSDWAKEQKEIEKTREFFADLYRLYFELQREIETEEIIVANGTLCDRNDPSIMHPVLTHRVKLDYDDDKNIMHIRDTEADSELYSTIFQNMDDVNLSGIKQLAEDLQLNDYHPLDRNQTPSFLNKIIHQLSASSIYSDNGIPDNWKASNRLLMYSEPCFIVRKRLDGTVKAINSIIENVEETGEIPAPICDIVSGGKIDISEEIQEDSIEEQLAAVGGESVDILLSKEANKEQLEIARRIENYNAVLVQGPPGTGKTHTIANLMGHFLAQGKSVLVTSHTTKALKVLKEKVAPGLQNLCVSMLDDSNADMEKSVDGITEYMSKTTSFDLKREMDIIAVERQGIIKDLADVRRKIFSIINQECSCIVYNGEGFSPSEAAAFVTEEADELSYIPGTVIAHSPLPLSYSELTELYRSNDVISKNDENELANGLPDPLEILSPSVYKEVLEKSDTARNNVRKIASEREWKVTLNGSERMVHIKGQFNTLDIKLPTPEHVKDLLVYAQSFGKIEKWMTAVAIDGKRGGNYRQQWLGLIGQINDLNEYADSLITEQIGINLSFVDPLNIEKYRSTFESMRNAFIQKGKLGKLALMTHKDYAPALEAVLINGRQAQSAKDCEIILHHIELESLRFQCAGYWDELMAVHSLPKFFDLDKDHQERIAKKYVFEIKCYLEWHSIAYSNLVKRLKLVGIPANILFKENRLDSDMEFINKVLYSVENDIPSICGILMAVLEIGKHTTAINKTKSVLSMGERGSSQVCKSIISSVEQNDASGYAQSYAMLVKIFDKYTLQEKRNSLLQKLDPVAPEWADAIRKHEGIHGNTVPPGNIEEAWKWKQLYSIIDEITKVPFGELQAESIRLSKEYRKVTADYAEKSGWYHLLKRTESDIDLKQALQGWKLTVKKIGKGTGKQAPRLKAEARKAMSKCQNGVPAWIMPINRALDNLNPKTNRFDIIIIDEASQSDVSSLAVLYMGKKLIIVGDDRQVSPMAVGEEIDKLQAMEQMYIKGKIPNSHLYNSKTSIYDIASTTFQPLMLREHFRCVPEIIGFSNMLSYDYRIKPLRDASSSKLLPAVVNYRVTEGKRNPISKNNPNEATAIIALIKACMEQPEYEGKSFGVISLLGDEQVKLISSYIEKEIDPKEVRKRNILCGNSANFQGDERDVVFLSVVDSGDGTGPLHMRGYGVDDAYRKRYNVATSRAKDQLWVVHSLDSAVDLKPGDIRKTLIDYSRDPHASDIVHSQIEERSESPFENAVARALVDRGYHIVQQWKVGSYRLDMIVVCEQKKIAIECDGERWHSGEAKVREDMQRQTILERLGWRFIRIRGSEYYRYPEQTIDRVISELTQYGIAPEEVDTIEKEDRNSELLCRIKNRAARILNGEVNEPDETYDDVIEAALNPKSMENEYFNDDIMFSADLPDNTPNIHIEEKMADDDLIDEQIEDTKPDDGKDNILDVEVPQESVSQEISDIFDDEKNSFLCTNEVESEKENNSAEKFDTTEEKETSVKTLSVADKLIQYKALFDEGILTRDEFDMLKHKLLKEL